MKFTNTHIDIAEKYNGIMIFFSHRKYWYCSANGQRLKSRSLAKIKKMISSALLLILLSGCGAVHKQIIDTPIDSIENIPAGEYGIIIGDSISRQIGQRNDLLQPIFGFPIVNKGIGGNTSSQVADRWVDDVLANNPKVVIVHVGVNDFRCGEGKDAELFRQNMTYIFQTAKCPMIVHNIPLASDMDNDQRRIIQELNIWLMTLQSKYNYRLIDEYEFSVRNRYLYKDNVHPNNTGVEEIIKLMV